MARQTYSLNGPTTFTFPFPVYAADEIRLQVSDGTTVTPTAYTINGIGAASAGVTVVWPDAPTDATNTLEIIREVNIERVTNFTMAGAVRTKPLDLEFDHVYDTIEDVDDALQVQIDALDEVSGRALVHPIGADAPYAAEGRRIEDLAPPFADNDAATKEFVLVAAASAAAGAPGLPSTILKEDSIALMQALSGLTNGQRISVRYYNVEGDFGGGEFRYDAGSAATVDNGLVFAATGMGSVGRHLRIVDGDYWLNWWGVDRTGVTDITPRLLLALRARAAGNGGILRVAPGTYLGTSRADLVGTEAAPIRNLHIRGAGARATVFKASGGSTNRFRVENAEDCSVMDCGFDFNGQNPAFAEAFTFIPGERVIVDRCDFFDTNPEMATFTVGTGDGVTTTFTRTETTFVDRMMHPGTVSVTAGSVVLTDSDSYFGELKGTGGSGFIDYGNNNGEWHVTSTFAVAPALGVPVTITFGRSDQRIGPQVLGAKDVTVTNCNLSNGCRIHVRRPSRRSMIAHNRLFGVNDNGLALAEDLGAGAAEVTVLDAGNHTISNNLIFYPTASAIVVGTDGETLPSTTAGVSNIIISDNVVVCNIAHGVNVNQPFLSRRISIQDNIFLRVEGSVTGTDRVGIRFGNTPGSLIDNHVGIIVSGNQVFNYVNEGMRLGNAQRIRVTNNIFDGNGVGDQGWFLGELYDAVFEGNTVLGYNRPVRTQASGQIWRDVHFRNNVVETRNQTNNNGIVTLVSLSSSSRVKFQDNVFYGSGTGVARATVTLDGATTPLIDYIGNDYSRDAGIQAFRFLNSAALAAESLNYGNKGLDARILKVGTGTPEGVVTAPIGSLYQRTDGGNATALYVKGSTAGNTGWLPLDGIIDASLTYDPPSLAVGTASAAQNVTVTGAALGDFVQVSFSRDAQGIEFPAWVRAANEVRFYARNPTGNPAGTVDLAEGTLRIRVRKQ